MIRQIMRFILVGGLSTLLDFIVFSLLISCQVHYLGANLCAFMLSLVFNYWASMHFVFQSSFSKEERWREFLLFLVLALSGLLIQELILYLLIEQLSLDAHLAKLAGILVVMVYNFLSRKALLESEQ
ncbi:MULTISPECIES: GtrA family protein [Aerococcus]|uniref:GtrA family protein n=1 Tax=Aerococcus TaxID=1375 RepID=UPI000200EF4F|nr:MULTISPECIES: GtrA family protein [Aerococcus]AEA01334.1 GtrA-like protein [Aerococcus sp. Group 1]KAA9299916.1 GtrA family protein [Aerococcus tenax]MCY3030256.1 GtrA family protein [Aerococcus sp. Group 1]MCY3054630.1 GtrA family protein [Aerococcus sp. Group 1]MCY3056360.1 GtrA family protein [Aerococcus sp. Group 1]